MLVEVYFKIDIIFNLIFEYSFLIYAMHIKIKDLVAHTGIGYNDFHQIVCSFFYEIIMCRLY